MSADHSDSDISLNLIPLRDLPALVKAEIGRLVTYAQFQRALTNGEAPSVRIGGRVLIRRGDLPEIVALGRRILEHNDGRAKRGAEARALIEERRRQREEQRQQMERLIEKERQRVSASASA